MKLKSFHLTHILVFGFAAILTACSGKSSMSHSPYGNGESENGGIGLGTLRRVHFGFDDSTVSPNELETLKYNVRKMEKNQKMKVLVEGHTDERGSAEYNIALGERRAQAVVKYLNDGGISRARLDYKSWGEERALDPQKNSNAYRLNRRAEFIITAK